MLRKARFKNFTCIPNDTWLFAPGLNVIVGENGLGKTHVLKALYAMLKVRADVKDLPKNLLGKAYADKLGGRLRKTQNAPWRVKYCVPTNCALFSILNSQPKAAACARVQLSQINYTTSCAVCSKRLTLIL
ncbi:MAG: AAA family ATPase [Actinomycetaceae bacterium]|nr:AAA family ATPase [Actinomycetaceae bacterium]